MKNRILHSNGSLPLKGNLEKCDLPPNTTEEIQINTCRMAIFNDKCKRLLGIKINYKPTFEPHICQSETKWFGKNRMPLKL